MSDVCELWRFVVLSVLVFFLELAVFGTGSRRRLMVGFGSVCVCGAAPTGACCEGKWQLTVVFGIEKGVCLRVSWPAAFG